MRTLHQCTDAKGSFGDEDLKLPFFCYRKETSIFNWSKCEKVIT
ncbi:hypothetical protein RUMHYD_02298 [Blautia hydrogenotrophica DSM 10507]|uniref:Uncharacterized protein n=1 Tax=Blautia hydrogenotrophica (strain DSM 10507 / JCM 14656 / S5a33) TaxID=476272 RepID=C0CN60_BLAHS|nr:hypothetical protein RUMHYD_02298 [Blautia hydrogenotrophica DSM 10507]